MNNTPSAHVFKYWDALKYQKNNAQHWHHQGKAGKIISEQKRKTNNSPFEGIPHNSSGSNITNKVDYYSYRSTKENKGGLLCKNVGDVYHGKETLEQSGYKNKNMNTDERKDVMLRKKAKQTIARGDSHERKTLTSSLMASGNISMRDMNDSNYGDTFWNQSGRLNANDNRNDINKNYISHSNTGQTQSASNVKKHLIEKEDLVNTVNILYHYINTLNVEFYAKLREIKRITDAKILKWAQEKQFWTRENNELKWKLLEIWYTAKIVDTTELIRETRMQKWTNWWYQENVFLRRANINTAINVSWPDFLMYNNTHKPPDTNYNQTENENVEEKDVKINAVDTPVAKHKRQKTQFNWNDVNSNDTNSARGSVDFNSIDRDISTSGFESTDAFGKSLDNMLNMSKTMKRNNASKKTIFENDSNENPFSTPSSAQGLSNSNKKQQLYYRTPKEKEEKKNDC